ncbi:hypothetical protein F0U59_01585 [Archangium gephyra]|nr:hypothetical protein F0U59_01585 [Archangium gephyra]
MSAMSSMRAGFLPWVVMLLVGCGGGGVRALEAELLEARWTAAGKYLAGTSQEDLWGVHQSRAGAPGEARYELWHFDGAKVKKLPLPESISQGGAEAYALAAAGSEQVWVAGRSGTHGGPVLMRFGLDGSGVDRSADIFAGTEDDALERIELVAWKGAVFAAAHYQKGEPRVYALKGESFVPLTMPLDGSRFVRFLAVGGPTSLHTFFKRPRGDVTQLFVWTGEQWRDTTDFGGLAARDVPDMVVNLSSGLRMGSSRIVLREQKDADYPIWNWDTQYLRWRPGRNDVASVPDEFIEPLPSDAGLPLSWTPMGIVPTGPDRFALLGIAVETDGVWLVSRPHDGQSLRTGDVRLHRIAERCEGDCTRRYVPLGIAEDGTVMLSGTDAAGKVLPLLLATPAAVGDTE